MVRRGSVDSFQFQTEGHNGVGDRRRKGRREEWNRRRERVCLSGCLGSWRLAEGLGGESIDRSIARDVRCREGERKASQPPPHAGQAISCFCLSSCRVLARSTLFSFVEFFLRKETGNTGHLLSSVASLRSRLSFSTHSSLSFLVFLVLVKPSSHSSIHASSLRLLLI